MTFYYSIIEQERKEAKEVYQQVAKKNLIFQLYTLAVSNGLDGLIENDVAKSTVLLNAAYRLQDSKLSEQDLDYLVGELENWGSNLVGRTAIEPQVLAAKTDLVKARVEFYQQLIQQEKTATTYEDAVKAQFGSAAAFRTALQPIAEAERKLYTMLKEEALLETVNGTAEAENELYALFKQTITRELLNALDVSLTVLEDVRESAIRQVFPK